MFDFIRRIREYLCKHNFKTIENIEFDTGCFVTCWSNDYDYVIYNKCCKCGVLEEKFRKHIFIENETIEDRRRLKRIEKNRF